MKRRSSWMFKSLTLGGIRRRGPLCLAASVASWMVVSWIGCFLLAAPSDAADRPNILWLTSEDNGPHLGCYGDTFADTPHIDRLASRGLVYLHCWSTAPVCAPARTTLISGIYPPATGSEHMRSMTRLPAEFQMYPQYLREAGYYCTNNSKEDYNLAKPGSVWDDSSRKAHWKNRKSGQPFFAIFNHTISHESQIRKRPHKAVHDPAKVRVPAYHPDTPEVRQDWAQYYDKVTEMDARVGANLKELEEAGLADDTIVFYYGDHGSGMPRSKRWPYNSGLQVPLVVHIPEKFKHLAPADYQAGAKTDRLVGFIDFAPTLLSLIGIKPPPQMQGYAFLGEHAAPPQPYIYGFRGRMDERYDLVRSIRDKRFIYIRNYMPHKVYGQFIAYMFQTPTTRVWKQRFDAGKLNAAQRRFWETKPTEELYDLEADPDEVQNLASSPEHQETLKRLRAAQRQLVLTIRDVGFLPEEEIHTRGGELTPYEMGHDAKRYPLERILETAELASSAATSSSAAERETALLKHLADPDSAVRYWAALGFVMQGDKQPLSQEARDALRKALADKSPSVRVTVAQVLAQRSPDDRSKALDLLIESADLNQQSVFIAMLAANALDDLDQIAAPGAARIAELPKRTANVPQRMGAYVGNLLNKTLSDLKQP